MIFDLVFEGGGAKGMSFVGALEAFHARGLRYGRLMGTSAGAIIATSLAAGYTVPEIYNALNETTADGQPVFATFLAPPRPFTEAELEASSLRRFLTRVNVPFLPDFLERRLDEAIVRILATERLRGLLAFIERGGWYSADPFVTWLQRRLDEGKYNGHPRRFSGMTLAEFYRATGSDLTLIAADITANRMLVLNYRTAPDLPVVWATRMSMSVPLLWEEVVWQREWGLYRGRDLTGHAIVDGGLLSNFPIELFISQAPQVTAVMGTGQGHEVMGFLIDEDLPVPGAPSLVVAEEGGLTLEELTTVQRLKHLVDTAIQAHDKAVIETFAHLVVRLPARGYGTTEFAMRPDRRDALIAAARTVTQAYLERRLAPADIAGKVVEPLDLEVQATEQALRWLAE